MKERSLQMVNDGKDSYFCTNYEIAMRELPAINFKKIDAIKKCFENLHKAEILVKKKIINDENLEYDYWTLNREKYQTISAVT